MPFFGFSVFLMGAMKHTTSDHTVEFLYRQYQAILVDYVRRAFPYLSAQDAEELIQDLFVVLQRRGTTILGDCSLESLKRHAFRLAIALLRARRALKRGAGKVSSLDHALETIGFEPASKAMEPEPGQILQAVHQLEIADRVIKEAFPMLSEREVILVRHIRRWAPVELTLQELALELTPMQRQRFLPVRRNTSLEEAEVYIVRQISRSKASLQEKLREVRASLDL